jgi:protoheme IX farnesyltransferase
MSNLSQTTNDPLTESQIGDFYALLKPKVMSLVVFTGFAGMWLAPGFESFHPFLSFLAIFSLALGSGAAGAFNMWYERDIDALMQRTRTRPLPAGIIHPDDALGFAIILSIISIMMMGLSSNWLAAGLLALANFYYVVIYTIWLKKRTPQNIVIGGAAGAFPPVIGWAAITGNVSIDSIVLFMIIFLWTPPHFWALSLFMNSDYKKANIPMLPVVAGEKSTKVQMFIYTLILLPFTLLPSILGTTGWLYGINAAVLGLLFVLSAYRVLLDKTQKSAKLMFGYSVFYLFALFLGMILDAA